MGGTFDPIHIGHMLLAQSALEQLQLDEVIFLPNGNPPHKKTPRDRAGELQRLEMTRLAVQDEPGFRVDDREIRPDLKDGEVVPAPAFHYSKDTIRQMALEHPEVEYYFIVGADSLMTFHHWVEPETISRYCILAAAVRDGETIDSMKEQAAFLKEKYGTRVVYLEIPPMDVSSTELRRMCSLGRSLRYLVPDRVWGYIRDNGLYREE